jgi:large subunit ribosomal protein L17
MRHQIFGRKLNRDVKERKALFKSLISSLILYGKIKTSLAKGKAIKGFIDKLVSLAKRGTSSAFTQIQSFLGKKKLSEKLIKEIVPKYQERVSGYTTLKRVGKRDSDAAEEVVLEWCKSSSQLEKEKNVEKAKINGNKKTRLGRNKKV